MEYPIFKKRANDEKVGNEIYGLNIIDKPSPNLSKEDNDDDILIETETAKISSIAILEPGEYIIRRPVLLNNGALHPGMIVVDHFSDEKNIILSTNIISPLGVIPLQKLDENEQFVVFKHEVPTLYGPSEFSSPFNNVIFNYQEDDSCIIKDGVPEELESPDLVEPLTPEEFSFLPYDLNTVTFPLKHNGYAVSLHKGEGIPEDTKEVGYPVLIKFANGFQTIGTTCLLLDPILPTFIMLLKGFIMEPLTIENYMSLLGVNNIEEICPVQIFDMNYDHDSKRLELNRIVEMDKEYFFELLKDSVI